MSGWDLIVERKFQEAMEEGAFENLSGQGRPLPPDENPYEDPAMRMSYRLLRNNGFSLPWIEEARDIDRALESACENLGRSWQMARRRAERALTLAEAGEDAADWRRARNTFIEKIAETNRRIQTYNLTAPSGTFHRMPINAQRELEKVVESISVTEAVGPAAAKDAEPANSRSILSRMLYLARRRIGPLTLHSLITAIMLAAIVCVAAGSASAGRRTTPEPAIQTLIVRPVLPVAVAPNQPEVTVESTVGIINAVCQVKLNIVGCNFAPQNGKITCDTNGDGVPELMIPLTEVSLVNAVLVQALVPALPPQLAGTPFPLSCCGGLATLTLSKTFHDSPDNIFGDFTLSITCPIDLGERAPVVISASPSGGDCAIGQNLLIPGSCFVRADGSPNVTSVFAVERGNPSNVIQSESWALLNPNLIDAFFRFGAGNAGKTFLIFVSGPNGTSRNLLTLPVGASAACPLGNEQGILVTFDCQSRPATPAPSPPAEASPVLSCSIERSSSGSTSLVLTTDRVRGDAIITVGGIKAKKVKFLDPAAEPNTFGRVVLKGKICKGLPGMVVINNPDGHSLPPFQCGASCTP